MRILFVCDTPPRPEGPCDTVVAYNRIRLLAERGHAIGLACFLPRQAHPSDGLESMVVEMQMLPPPRALGMAALLRRLANPYRATFRAAFSPDMRKLAGRLVGHSRYEAVVAESAVMGQYLYRNVYLPAVRRVISCHGSLASRYSSEAALDLPWALRAAAPAFARAIERFEAGMYRYADRVLTLTVQERLELLRRFPELAVDVIPYGMDAGRIPLLDTARSDEVVWFRGSFGERGDRAALRWLLREVWPALSLRNPGLRLLVTGEGLRRDVRSLCQRHPRVEVPPEAGSQPEAPLQPRVCLCPVRVAGGLQTRVLEAMAAGVPVVTTSVGASGLPAQTGETLFLADTAHTMIEAAHLLLGDADLRRRMAAAAREAVAARFSWQGSIDRLEESLRRVVS